MVACQHFGIPTHKRTLNCVLSIHSTSEIIAYLYLSRLCSVCNTLVRTNTIFSRLSSFTPFYYLSLFSYSLARLVDHQPRKRSTRSVGCRSTTTACRKPIHAHPNVTDKHKCVTTTNANEYFYSAPTLPALWLFRSFSFVSFFSFHISSRSHFYHRWIIHVTVYFFCVNWAHIIIDVLILYPYWKKISCYYFVFVIIVCFFLIWNSFKINWTWSILSAYLGIQTHWKDTLGVALC